MPPTARKPKGRLKGFFVLGGVVFLAFLVVGLRFGAPGVLAPVSQLAFDLSGYFQKGVGLPMDWGRQVWEHYVALQNVEMENDRLKRQIEQLQRENAQYREASIANARLKRLLDIKEQVQIPPVAANVVGVDFAPWVATVTVDRGRKDGVRPGMVAVGGAGAIGQVVESSRSFSRIMLLSDHNSAVAAIVQRNRARGILKGDGNGMCVFSYVEKGADVEKGDRIVSSGTDQIFPKGLVLGEVTAVEPGTGADLFQSITVRPAVDLERVEEMLILLKEQPLLHEGQ